MRTTGKPFNIGKRQVYEAYQAVKSNGGAAGVDGMEQENEEKHVDRENSREASDNGHAGNRDSDDMVIDNDQQHHSSSSASRQRHPSRLEAQLRARWHTLAVSILRRS